ncbi:VWA domain-containing protein [Gracilinema caldarium]|uniref:vWA domain-containing protein n=1 Tax=Gracilinema caldarium TaxID=215591 RepID=UPI0026F2047B|nr:VWA domain-containing protein [Gracilinema caldarium]
MSFDNPQLLWALAILVPGSILFLRRRLARLAQYKTLTSAEAYIRLRGISIKSAVLFLLCFISLIVALAQPRWGQRLVSEYYSGLDLVLAFDVSRSMDLKDGDDGQSRLEVAKQAALNLIEARPDFRYAVTLGKGKAILAIPLTDDKESIINLIMSLSSAAISSAGSNLQELLELASQAFPEESPGKKRIILFSDGEDTKGSLSDVERVLQAKGIGVIAVGVGSLQGLPVPQADGTAFLRRPNGTAVISQLREPALQELAALSGGMYWNASREASMDALLNYLDALANGRAPLEYRRETPSQQVWFVLAAFLFFAAARLLEEGLWKKR